MLIGLDFETYGSVDLREHGLDRYVSDPHFTPLIADMYLEDSIFQVHASGGGGGVAPVQGAVITSGSSGAGGASSFSAGTKAKHTYRHYDFIENMEQAKADLRRDLLNNTLAAHNAGFEMAVLDWLGIEHPLEQVIDSAMVSRAAGAGSHLASAAPQLLATDKMAEGMDLIRLFSIPGKYQEANGSMAFDPQVIKDHPLQWKLFREYCELDGNLSYRIVRGYSSRLSDREFRYQRLTMEMNQVGWPVDVPTVQEMYRRYKENLELELEQFSIDCNARDLNLNSLKQLKDWCSDRGINATSFDEKHVASLLRRVSKKLDDDRNLSKEKREGYEDVVRLLQTKQLLGGSSLKKLKVILNTVGEDGRLRDQYMHCGAGQTLRTTGRSVQMQNLKRLGEGQIVMETLMDDTVEVDNDVLAENIRQVFTSSDPNGFLIVGDFASVESRGLAWLAGESWKLNAYRDRRDVYKDLASKIYGRDYDLITKSQRQTGKVGELSCGYGAGAGAVLEFAKNMGVEMSEGEAGKLVLDWRNANPNIVQFWNTLDYMLHEVVEGKSLSQSRVLADGFMLMIKEISTPTSLIDQAPDVRSIEVLVKDSRNEVFLRRVFLGCHVRGRNIGYFKPTNRKNGELWDNMYTNSKTKRREFHNLYGGKLAGILTQSFCRELFFQSLEIFSQQLRAIENATLIGQFHDEIVVDWVPAGRSVNDRDLLEVERQLEAAMCNPGMAKSFPLAAEIKHDYRYTK